MILHNISNTVNLFIKNPNITSASTLTLYHRYLKDVRKLRYIASNQNYYNGYPVALRKVFSIVHQMEHHD